MMNYTTLLDKDSVTWHPAVLVHPGRIPVMDYPTADRVGGLEEMAEINHAKAESCMISWTVRTSQQSPFSGIPQHDERDLHSPNPDMDEDFAPLLR